MYESEKELARDPCRKAKEKEEKERNKKVIKYYNIEAHGKERQEYFDTETQEEKND